MEDLRILSKKANLIADSKLLVDIERKDFIYDYINKHYKHPQPQRKSHSVDMLIMGSNHRVTVYER